MMRKLRVLIADDHYVVRLGLKILIDTFPGFIVVGEAENGKKVLEQVDDADYFILDLEMPILDGVETLKIIKRDHPGKKVVLLTNSMDLSTLVKAKSLKPNGFLFKNGMHDEIKTCLEQIRKGNYYTGRNCITFFERHKEEIHDVESLIRNMELLTKTELKILYKISENFSTNEIAEKLFNSPKTIDNHRTNIAKKLDISGYNNLQVIAIKNKVLIESLIAKLGLDP